MIDIRLLSNIANIKKYNKNDIIVTENDTSNEEMFILLTGKVLVVKNYGQKNQINLNEIYPGNIFGEMSLFCKQPRSATIVATEDVTVVSITAANSLYFFKRNTDVTFQMFETLCNRVAKLNNEITRINEEKTKLFKDYGIDEEGFYKSLIIPKGHKTYDSTKHPEYEKFVFQRVYTCMNCGQSFPGFLMLSSRLKPDGEMSSDMRRHYLNFNPLWYEIVTCPHCYFSTLESIYNGEEKPNKSLYENELNYLRSKINFDFEDPKDVNQIFNSYYLALACSSGFEKKKQIDAKLWLSLSWLYNDVNDKEMEHYAITKAYELTKAYYSECYLSKEAEQVALMIIGTLAFKLGYLDEAFLTLGKAKTMPEGKQAYKLIIDLELDKVREARKKS